MTDVGGSSAHESWQSGAGEVAVLCCAIDVGTEYTVFARVASVGKPRRARAMN